MIFASCNDIRSRPLLVHRQRLVRKVSRKGPRNGLNQSPALAGHVYYSRGSLSLIRAGFLDTTRENVDFQFATSGAEKVMPELPECESSGPRADEVILWSSMMSLEQF